jgi:hypothetical protein
MLRADGYVKVLDFGLAKLSEPGAFPAGCSDPEAQTQKQLQTEAGVIMGTVAKVARTNSGLQVDQRADI